MAKSLYNVKLEPEIKQQWQQIVESVMHKYDLESLGDTYPVLIDIISKDSTLFISDTSGFISAIDQNLSTIRKNVSALQNTFLANLTEAQTTMDGMMETYQKELKENQETIAQLKSELQSAQERIEQLETEQKNWIEQNEIFSLLEQINENTKKA